MKFHHLLLFLPISGCATQPDVLKSKYPYARLNQDYGILDEDDLRMSEQGVSPVPISEHSPEYAYWQCFPVSAVRFSCLDLGIDEDLKIHMADLQIHVTSNSNRYEEYGGRRGIEAAVCNEFIKKWKYLTSGQQHVCISGLDPGTGAINEKGKTVQVRSWTYDRIKTKKGCHSYFDHRCNIRRTGYSGAALSQSKVNVW